MSYYIFEVLVFNLRKKTENKSENQVVWVT